MIIHGDCLEKLKRILPNSVDSIITDPPYGLSFMGKKWDYDVPSKEIWSEALRVLKPGGHLLSFAGTRTYHRMAVNIEDAGFEIRDQIQWIYGSGFPKSHNIGDGRGTALKPANEPIVVARKPLEKGLTVAQNVLKYGTGALNIDASRIEAGEDHAKNCNRTFKSGIWQKSGEGKSEITTEANSFGRWPANVLLDEEAAQALDEQSGTSISRKSGPRKAKCGFNPTGDKVYGKSEGVQNLVEYADSGGASRFFYVAKASKRERNAGLDSFDCCQVKHNSCDENTELEVSILKVIFESMQNLNIVVYGDHIMVTCPKECTSTTRMAIQQITESKTWNWLIHSLTSVSTLDVPSETTSGINLAECVEKLRELMRQTGTLQGRDGSLMVDAAHAIYQKLLSLSDGKNWKTFSSFHPTVKPIRLMEYLIKLVTPPNGTCLDPFMGSGSTGVAAKNLGFNFIGIERELEYFEIAKKRIEK